jgi:ABC-2 type transport system permease protein
MDRFLTSPVRRGSLITGRLLQGALVIAIQSVIIVGLALAVGASFPNGVPGVVGLIAIAALLGSAFAALSIGLGLLVRREETLIAAVQFLLLPLTFLSTSFMARSLMPGWISAIATANPVNWSVEAARTALTAHPDWAAAGRLTGGLALLAAVLLAVSTRAFRSYQRSL